METKFRPVGFFDSGVGGISVLKEAVRILPHENYIYLGDNAHAPYGDKSEDLIREYSLSCADFLFKHDAKTIVIACNTATSIAVKEMREKYNIPVISIEPAVKPALEASDEGKVVVMATPATLSQQRYMLLLEKLGNSDRVINVPCEGLADIIEKNDPDSEIVSDYVRKKLCDYSGEEISGIVLGCTHYSFIGKQISDAAEDIFGRKTEIFDGRYGVARQLKRVLEEEGIANNEGRSDIEFYASGDQDEVGLFRKFLDIGL